MKKIPRALTRRVFCVAALFLSGLAFAQNCTTGEFQYPVSGQVTSDVGPRSSPGGVGSTNHKGMDIGVKSGTPVYAAGGGTVSVRVQGGGYKGYGYYVVITHPNGTSTLYGHLSQFQVTDGQKVSQGQQIALSGGDAGVKGSGSGTGAHLHFSVIDKNGNEQPTANGQYWDQAAGKPIGSSVTGGECIKNIASAGLSPGGSVAGTPSPGATGDGTGAPTTNGTTGGNGTTGDSGGAVDVPTITEPYDLSKIDLEKLLPKPETWLKETNDIMASFGLFGYLKTLGIALLFACFVYSIVNANYFYQTDQYMSLFGRLIIAAGLILGSSAIGTSIMNMWKGAYGTMQTRIITPATTELESALNELGPQLKQLALTTAAMNTLAAVIPEIAGIDVGEEVVKNFAELGGQSIQGLFTVMVLMGSIYGIYFLAIYVSGMIALLAGVLLPVLAPFLVVPGSSSWFTRWFSMIFLSLVVVVALPFLLHVVVKLGVTAPMVEVNGIATQMQQQADALTAQASQYPQGMPNALNPIAWGDYIIKLGVVATKVSVNMTLLYIQWGFALVILAITILASIYLMQQLPGLLQGFIGGAFGVAARPVSGAVLGSMMSSAAMNVGSAGGAAGKMGGAALGAAGGAAAGGIRKGAAAGVAAIKNKMSSGGSPGGNKQAALPDSNSSNQPSSPKPQPANSKK
jgi:murein DD-endopeptidase MepM/ murein hydrolase activator NlpD